MSAFEGSPQSPTHHTVVGLFDQPSDAREAMVALERKGIDALDIRLVDAPSVPTTVGARETDLAEAGGVAKNFLMGGLIGAVVAFVVAGLVVGLITTDGGPALLAAFIVAVPGFMLGGFYGGARRLPVNEDAMDTYSIDPADSSPVGVEVDLRDDTAAQTAVETLQAMHAKSIQHHSH